MDRTGKDRERERERASEKDGGTKRHKTTQDEGVNGIKH